METAAAPVERPRPAPLAALGLVLALPATFVLGNPIAVVRWAIDDPGPTFFAGGAPLGLLILAVGGFTVIGVGRGTLGVWRTVALAGTTWLSLAVSALVLVAIGFATLGNCDGGVSHPITLPLVIAGAVVYVAAAYWALRKGRWWGVPLAVVGALVLCLLLAQSLPGVPNSTDPCFD